MNTIKKTIFLSNKTDNNIKTLATVTLENKNKLIFGTIKSYNNTPKGDLFLGIKCGNKIIKQNVNFNNYLYNFKLNEDINLDENIGCVLLSYIDNKLTPIVRGSEKADNSKSQILSNLKTSLNKLKENTIQKNLSIKTPQPENLKVVDEDTQDNSINISQSENNAVSPIRQLNYQDAIMLHINSSNEDVAMAQTYALFESDENEINETIDKEIEKDNNNEHKFYLMLKSQLDELFDRYPRERNLETLIENSKWVKIDTEEPNKHYVVGTISIDNDVKYICYGVPGNYNNEPPIELKKYSQWLPVDTEDPYNNGYWVMYQDSDTGENINLN